MASGGASLTSSSTGMSAEMSATISLIRACVVSRKDATNICDVKRDYRDLEGCDIPFRTFGYRNLDQFLEASGEFVIRKNGNDMTIAAVPSKESLHIRNMVRNQKSNKKRKYTMVCFLLIV